MVPVRPRLRSDNDLSSAAATEFRRIRIGENLEFLNGVHDGAKRKVIDGRIVVIDAVEEIAVRRFSSAGRVESAAITQDRTRSCRHSARNELRKCFDLPPGDRQSFNSSKTNDVAQR